MHGKKLVVSSVEIKTKVSASTVGGAVQLSSPDLVRCSFGDDNFKKFVPLEHMGQLLHQLIVLRVHYCLCACAAESGPLCTVLVRFSQQLMDCAIASLPAMARPLVHFTYVDEVCLPQFVDKE